MAVLAYAVAMAFLESAVVIYLQRALGIDPRALFPLQDPAVTADLAVIEVGREAATLVKLGTWDLLFLIPVPWTGPVWAPVTISLALSGLGLAGARRIRGGRPVRAGRAQVGAGIVGGLVVILSFTLDAGRILVGAAPDTFAWPIFAAGLAIAAWGATTTLGPPSDRPPRGRVISPTDPPPGP